MEIPLLIVSLIFLCFFSSALSSSVVTHLPGFQGPLPFYLETGYVEVDLEHGGEFFYYFIESENKPAEDPLFLWLTGGPRCTVFNGLVFEIGPLKFVTAEYNGSLPSLVYNPYSWTTLKSLEQQRRKKKAKMEIPLLIVSLIFLCFFSSALSFSVVTHLPGFQGPLPFYLETGYVEVDLEHGGEFFYYFIESENKPAEDPLFLWLTGGPRCTVFNGLVFEIAEYNGSLPSLGYHPYAWTKVANVIFLDSPLGSGFSYSRKYEGYDANDTVWSEQTYKFLIQWLVEHPQFISNPLYIAGDSYAGKIVPMVAKRILDGIDEGKEPLLNLQGYIIGNPATGGKVDRNSQIPYAHSMGIISDDFFEMIQKSCSGQDYRTPTDPQCQMYLTSFNNSFLSEINQGHILEVNCPICYLNALHGHGSTTFGKRILKQNQNIIQPPFPDLSCRCYASTLAYYWANRGIVRKALNVRKGTIKEWVTCNRHLPYTKELKSNMKYHLSLLQRGYRALVYSGDHDLMIPFSGTKQWIKPLNSPIVENWRSWHVDGQVAGYTMTYFNNLTFATVKGAGHTAPEYKPQECLAMITRWISGAPL
ncbi:serine carboxypeptidase-like 18 isoform X2 [Zingiber officinale]|uniref:serine carboxypeptidase-like 18 isoform X2 n=1 Tax=Zingiber officinale TaxID=94328 RepID=UPI001C4D7F09|nr:serine carboxypeptidase-like 18 isoform X2 [Zingiber officinale]